MCAPSIFSLASFMLNFHATHQGVPLTGLPSTTRKAFHFLKQMLVSFATHMQHINDSALLSVNLLYNYNIDVAGVCALQVLMNHFAVDVHTTISCDAFDSPHLYSDDDWVLRRQYYATQTQSPSGPNFSSEAGSDPRGHLGVTWGVYLCAGKPPLADIILSHPPDLT